MQPIQNCAKQETSIQLTITNMNPQLTYKVIKTKEQYYEYCALLEEFVMNDDASKADDIELLHVLIDKWDDEHNTFTALDPVELLKSLMKENGVKQSALAGKLGVTKGYVSEILSYKKGFSTAVIRKLAELFSVRQEAFNRSYALKPQMKAYQQPESTLSAVAEPGINYGNAEEHPEPND